MAQVTQQDLQDPTKVKQITDWMNSTGNSNMTALFKYGNANAAAGINAMLSPWANEINRYQSNVINNGYSDNTSEGQRFASVRDSINKLPDWLKSQFTIPTNPNNPKNDMKVVDNSSQMVNGGNATIGQTATASLSPNGTAPTGNLAGTSGTVKLADGRIVSEAMAAQLGQTGTPYQPPQGATTGQTQVAQAPQTGAQVNLAANGIPSPTAPAGQLTPQPVTSQQIQDLVNQYVKAGYSQQDASKRVQELWGGRPGYQEAINGVGAPAGYYQIANPNDLNALAHQANFNPALIVKVGSKLFAPNSLKLNSSGSVAVGDKSTVSDPTFSLAVNGLTGNTTGGLTTDSLSSAVNDYMGQYSSQLSAEFTKERTAYWDALLKSSTFGSDTYNALQAKYNTADLSTQLAEKDGQIAAATTTLNTLLQENREQPVSMGIISGREAMIQNHMSIQINTMIAARNVLQGQYDRAQNIITNQVNLANQDNTNKLNALKSVYDDTKALMSTEQSQQFQMKLTQMQIDANKAAAQYQTVAQMALAYPNANISVTDSFADAAKKIAPYYTAQLNIKNAIDAKPTIFSDPNGYQTYQQSFQNGQWVTQQIGGSSGGGGATGTFGSTDGSLNAFINKYAPASDGNNVAAYVSAVTQATGANPNTNISQIPTQSLVQAIMNHESGSKLADNSVVIPSNGNQLAYKNNNPGNLRFAGQAGAVQGEGGFAKFATPQAGYNALVAQVKLDQQRASQVTNSVQVPPKLASEITSKPQYGTLTNLQNAYNSLTAYRDFVQKSGYQGASFQNSSTAKTLYNNAIAAAKAANIDASSIIANFPKTEVGKLSLPNALVNKLGYSLSGGTGGIVSTINNILSTQIKPQATGALQTLVSSYQPWAQSDLFTKFSPLIYSPAQIAYAQRAAQAGQSETDITNYLQAHPELATN